MRAGELLEYFNRHASDGGVGLLKGKQGVQDGGKKMGPAAGRRRVCGHGGGASSAVTQNRPYMVT